MKLKTLLQGCGTAILAMLLPTWSRLSPHHQALYHSFLPMQTEVRGILIDLTVVALLASLLFWYLEKHRGGRRSLAWGLVAALLAPGIVTDIVALLRVEVSSRFTAILFYGILLLAVGLWWLRPKLYLRGARAVQMLLVLAGLSAVWMVPELLYLAFRGQRSDTPVPIAQPALSAGHANPGPTEKRIVWILFDELSYDQTFEHRFPGLALPNFDQLKQESVSFANLIPAGTDTERVVPSLFLGKEVGTIEGDLDGAPSFRWKDQKVWQRFDPHATIFSDAQRLGWTTGVVGWYNPYCRILKESVDYCYWRMDTGQWDGIGPRNSSLQNAMVPIMRSVRSWQGKPEIAGREGHASDLNTLMAQATTLIRDARVGFVFIHLPIPHPPGIFDRKSGKLSWGGSYIDNLALADRALGQLLATIAETPQAAETTLILCSDHSWRVPLWSHLGDWTKEDEVASKGHFDTRPVLMIRSPGQKFERTVTVAFPALHIHEILESLLRGEPLPIPKAEGRSPDQP
jgi:hypothetical protein